MTRTSRNTVRALGVGAAAFALALAAPAMASAHEGEENNNPECTTAETDYVGAPLTFNVGDSGGCEDKDGDEITVASVGAVDGPGSAVVGADGTSVVYTGTDDLDGTAKFTATVKDEHGAEASWNFVITYDIAFKLDAIEDEFPGKANTPITGDVDSNDVGAERAKITAFSKPAHGKLDFDVKTGKFTYTPDKDWSGTDTFTYELKAGKFTDTATVSLKVSPEGGAGGPGSSPSPSPSKTKGPLAKTGSSLTTLGLVGGGVLIAGAGALLVARRRRGEV